MNINKQLGKDPKDMYQLVLNFAVELTNIH